MSFCCVPGCKFCKHRKYVRFGQIGSISELPVWSERQWKVNIQRGKEPYFFFWYFLFLNIFFFAFYGFIDSSAEEVAGNRMRERGSDTQPRAPGRESGVIWKVIFHIHLNGPLSCCCRIGPVPNFSPTETSMLKRAYPSHNTKLSVWLNESPLIKTSKITNIIKWQR